MKILMVGCGSIGKRHCRNIIRYTSENNIQLELDFLRSSNTKLPDDILEKTSNQYGSISELNNKYDTIFITNPTSLHYDTLLMLNDYSDNFFIEKPVFDKTDIDISKFQNTKKKYYVACPLRYTQVLLAAKEFVRKNQIFSVRAISSSYLPDWRPGTDYRNTYSAHKDLGGGVLIDLIHEWDYLFSFFGAPLSIQKYFGKYSDLEIDSEDLAVYIAKYNSFLLELHLDYCGKQTRRYCEFITADGLYTFDITNNQILKNGLIEKSFVEDGNDKYYRELQNFFSIIFGNVDNTNTIKHAIEVMNIATN